MRWTLDDEPFGERTHALMEMLAHDDRLPAHVLRHLDIIKERVSDELQRVFRPRLPRKETRI